MTSSRTFSSSSFTSLPPSLSTSAWSHPPLDVVAHIAQYLPLPSLLTLPTLSHYHHLLLSHPSIWRTPTLSLSLHHPHHSHLSSLLSSPSHSLFHHLQHVDLSHSLFSHTSLVFLHSCTALRSLKLHQSQFDPLTLTRLTSSLPPLLSSLQLSSLSLSPSTLHAISALSALTYLDLHSSTGIGGDDGRGWTALSALPSLRELNLEGCEGLDDAAMRRLLGFQAVKRDRVEEEKGEGEGEGEGEEVEEGEGGDGSELEEEVVEEEMAAFPHLVALRLSSPITDGSLQLLARRCPQLTSLSLTACKLITLEGVRALAASMLSLASLGLARCPLLFPSPPTTHPSPSSPSPSSSLSPSAPAFPSFPSLTLLTVSHLTNASLHSVLLSTPHLSHLAVSAHSLTSSSFPLLLSLSPPLRELGLSLWGGRGRRDVLFSRRVREVVRRWGKEVRGGMVMIEGEREVRGMVEEVVRGMEREEGVDGGWKEEKEEELDNRWRWTKGGRLKQRLHSFC